MERKNVHVHEKQLALLEIFDCLCKSNNFTYYLFAGTLLGAARHKGFIPWDPDLDVAMPRKDYEAFLKLYSINQQKSSPYFLGTYANQKDHFSPHAILYLNRTKLLVDKPSYERKYRSHEGVYIDVFPLDNGPDKPELQKKQSRKLAFYKKILYWKAGQYYHEGFLYKVAKSAIRLFLCILPLRFVHWMMNKAMSHYNSKTTNFIIDGGTSYTYEKTILPKDIYGTPTQLEFEGKLFSAPSKYSEYLKKYYGDYMSFPPEEARRAMLDKMPSFIEF